MNVYTMISFNYANDERNGKALDKGQGLDFVYIFRIGRKRKLL